MKRRVTEHEWDNAKTDVILSREPYIAIFFDVPVTRQEAKEAWSEKARLLQEEEDDFFPAWAAP